MKRLSLPLGRKWSLWIGVAGANLSYSIALRLPHMLIPSPSKAPKHCYWNVSCLSCVMPTLGICTPPMIQFVCFATKQRVERFCSLRRPPGLGNIPGWGQFSRTARHLKELVSRWCHLQYRRQWIALNTVRWNVQYIHTVNAQPTYITNLEKGIWS